MRELWGPEHLIWKAQAAFLLESDLLSGNQTHLCSQWTFGVFSSSVWTFILVLLGWRSQLVCCQVRCVAVSSYVKGLGPKDGERCFCHLPLISLQAGRREQGGQDGSHLPTLLWLRPVTCERVDFLGCFGVFDRLVSGREGTRPPISSDL